MSNYKKSYSHDWINYLRNAKTGLEETQRFPDSFSNLEKFDNNVYSTIDDLLEGLGIEEDVPFSPPQPKNYDIWMTLLVERIMENLLHRTLIGHSNILKT
jgi:hypothetical protein